MTNIEQQYDYLHSLLASNSEPDTRLAKQSLGLIAVLEVWCQTAPHRDEIRDTQNFRGRLASYEYFMCNLDEFNVEVSVATRERVFSVAARITQSLFRQRPDLRRFVLEDLESARYRVDFTGRRRLERQATFVIEHGLC